MAPPITPTQLQITYGGSNTNVNVAVSTGTVTGITYTEQVAQWYRQGGVWIGALFIPYGQISAVNAF